MALRSTLVRVAVAASLTCGAGSALAQGMCAALESRLAALQRSDGGPAIRQQQDGLREAQADYERAYQQARGAGCIGGGIFADRAPSCGRIIAGLDRAEAAVRRAEAQSDRFQLDPRRIADERRDILQALADNQCGPQYERFADRPPPRRRGIFSELFGEPEFGFNDFEDEFFDVPMVSTYRTLCVRTCDGYYFPISFATVQSQFARDEATCQSMCPAGNVQLFTHLNPGEDAASAVSLAGSRYSAMPNAFAFQNSYNPSCTCHGATAALANFTPVDAADTRVVARRAPVPIPVAKPDFEQDPETIANVRGRYEPGTIPPRNDAVANLGGEEGVRLIGPAYYYAQ